MRKKKEEPVEVKEEEPKTQDAGKKRILYELVDESPLREYVNVGALAKKIMVIKM